MTIAPLSDTQYTTYKRNGYLLVSDLIPRDIALQADACIWHNLGLSPNSLADWSSIPSSGGYSAPEILSCYTTDFLAAAALLCDTDPSTIQQPSGALAINIMPQKKPWQWPNPHIDHAIKDHGHKIFPLPFRIATMTFIHDINPHGGGTVIWPSSHLHIEALARSRSNQYEYMWELNQDLDKAALNPPVELVPKAGDVLFYHCLCAHAGSANISSRPRFAFNHKW